MINLAAWSINKGSATFRVHLDADAERKGLGALRALIKSIVLAPSALLLTFHRISHCLVNERLTPQRFDVLDICPFCWENLDKF